MNLFDARKTKELKEHQTYTAAAIAKRVGVSRAQYRRYEMGQSVPDLLVASKIAMVLNLQLSDLVEIVRATTHKDKRMDG